MEQTRITVATHPNGYSLDVDGNGYMYFSKTALLEGFMYHVGLEELNAIDADTMRDFIAASVVWKDNAEVVKSLIDTKKENEALSRQISNLKKQLKRMGDRLNGKSEEDDDS